MSTALRLFPRGGKSSLGLLAAVVAGLLSLVVVGCESRTNVRPVTGTITLDGQPLANSSITFQPVIGRETAADGMGSYGQTNSAGEFSLRLVDTDQAGAMIGKHSVRISLIAPAENGDELVSNDDCLPASARDGSLVFEVRAEGENLAEFHLKTN